MAQPQTSGTTWALISGACLLLGLAVGYVIFGGRNAAGPVLVPTGQTSAPAPAPAAAAPGLFDEQQAQVLRSIVAKDPRNAQAAEQLGNMLYDAGRFSEAVPIYQQAFLVDSRNVNLSTDLGTALWYSGRPDEALAQYAKSLAISPTHAQTLFNMGLVRRDGKQDLAGAVEVWERLLATNADYADRAKVQQFIADARQKLATTPIPPVRSTK
jgi:cytochrome c-type biogenesis protein CcmH/NrfG